MSEFTQNSRCRHQSDCEPPRGWNIFLTLLLNSQKGLTGNCAFSVKKIITALQQHTYDGLGPGANDDNELVAVRAWMNRTPADASWGDGEAVNGGAGD